MQMIKKYWWIIAAIVLYMFMGKKKKVTRRRSRKMTTYMRRRIAPMRMAKRYSAYRRTSAIGLRRSPRRKMRR